MEAVAQKWGVLDTENTEVIFQKQSKLLHTEGSATLSTNDVHIGAEINPQNHEENRQTNNVLENAKNKSLLHTPEPPILWSPTSSTSHHVTTESAPVAIVIQNKDEEQEFYLKKIFVMPPSHGFYCPHCRVCIEKVLVYKRPEEIEHPLIDRPIPGNEPPGIGDDHRIRCSACFQHLIQIDAADIDPIPSKPPASAPVPVPGDQPPEIPVIPRPITGSTKGLEILKSIVYGGLTEILASLSVVTSAASADATTLNIVALAIANLIGGLFVLVHNLRDLKAEEPRAQGDQESQTEAPPVNRYSEMLGDKDNFIIHAFVAIFSFLVFGLVPPLVYGFSFYESDDKDFKLGAVAIASLICIIWLAIAKAYTQSTNNNNYLTYLKTIVYYITTGALASVLTYVAGALMKRLVEQLGWFEPRPNNGFFLPAEMSLEKPRWGSY